MNLKHLTDNTLLSETKRLSRMERQTTTDVLHHIKEVETRKLFSDLKYSSMMDYLIKELGYSEGAASRRLQSARLLVEIPAIEDKIKDGSLSLSNLSKASGFFKTEDIKNPSQKLKILEKIENQSARECEKTLFSLGEQKPLPSEGIKIVSKDYQQIKVNVSDATFKLLEDVRQLLGCHVLNETFLKKLAEEASENIKRKKFKFADRPRTTTSNSRYITNSDKREVYKQSNGVCENCGSLFLVQNDHRKPFAFPSQSEWFPLQSARKDQSAALMAFSSFPTEIVSPM